ncbi:hypothetical protein BGZ70_000179 [Mortierella alpina]|uniref:Aminopeptidase P N-terminal domain-containing protein n=1 Tax=Mortierella alpina TaxID=64518 RepID=A0A9P6JFQ5_MORAP|nr:hypothetical protein BGZ70_000179 [Mortierella alpina]
MLARTGLKYPSKLHCEKVASFLPHSARHEAIILAKGTEVQNRDNTDVELDFRQESNFYYLTGVLEADFYFVYDLSRGHSYLIAPDLDPLKAVWKGPSLSDKQLLERYNVDHVVRFSNLLDLLKHQLKPKHIHGWNSPEKVPSLGDQALERELEHYISHRLVHPKKDELQEPKPRPHPPHDHGPYGDHHGHRCRHGFPGDHRDHKHRHDPDHGHPGHDGPKKKPDTTLLEAMIFARINKSPIEIALSRESTRISSDAHRLVMKSVRAGMYEYQLEALFRYECARQGGKTQAYLPIVGTGVNGAYLHYTRNDTRLKDGQLLLIDAACEADCYGSDITRTIPVNGRFTADQLEIYNLVLEMQTSVIRSMAQGVDWTQMNILSQKIGIRGLKRLGILKGEEDDLFESGVIKIFYPHGLGHLLGLNVHDDGLGLGIQLPAPKSAALASLLMSKTPVQFHSATADAKLPGGTLPPPSSRRNKAMGSSSLYATPATKLEPGMLLTIEPGIYFNPAQIESALDTFHLAPYLDEPTLRRFMPVGGVRLEDVVLILPDGSVDNITTAPKDPREVEQIIQEGRREYQQSLTQDLGSTVAEKSTMIKEVPLASEPPRGIKKRIGVFKKLLRAIRNMF